MSSKSIIELISHPHAVELRRARHDMAKITSTELVERPYWYRNTETGQLYYDIMSCIGWPGEVSDAGDGLPGYCAIMGVVKPSDSMEGDAEKANFQLLAEAESHDVPTLLGHCLRLRAEYGFGVQKNLLTFWLGDSERFLTTLALLNENLIKDGGDDKAILISPPDDWYTPKIFDNYVRSLKTVLLPESTRFYFGYNDILQNRLREFKKDDPCVFAVGGLVHSLLCRCTWLDQAQETAFAVEDEDA